MATLKQKQLAIEIVNNLKAKKKKNKKELLVSAGYDETTAEATPERTIGQKGVQEELINLGFTEDRAKKVVASIMTDITVDPNSRLKAADMTFKVHGSYAPEKSQALNINIKGDIKDFNELDAIREKYEEELKTKLIS